MEFETECLLGDVAELVRGVAYKPDALLDSTQDGAVPLLRATNINAQALELEDVLHVPQQLVKRPQYLQKFDVVIAMSSGSRAAVGRLAQLRRDWFGTFGAFCGAIRPVPTKVDAEYLGYLLYSPDFRARIETYAAGTAIMNLSREHLLGYPIRLPKRVHQRAIAHLLGSIDDRIDLLRQTNATLESIAQALFKSWFIDFDPVRAKAEGRAPEGMDAATAALFPSEFEESQLGLIPKGWSVVPFLDNVNVVGGGTPKTSVAEFWGGDIPWFSVVDAPDPGQVFTTRTEKSITALGIENSATRLLPAWATIISARGTVSKLAMAARPMAMNQSCYGLISKAPETEPLVYLAAQHLVDDLKRLAHGGVFDTITRSTLSSVNVVRAASSVQKAFAVVVKPLFAQIQLGVERTAALTELRDTLLPRLISGKLRVPEAQEQLEDIPA